MTRPADEVVDGGTLMPPDFAAAFGLGCNLPVVFSLMWLEGRRRSIGALKALEPMKLFECQHCGQTLYFENVRCESCGHALGYLPLKETVTALEPDQGVWKALAEPKAHYRYCSNEPHGVCNWLLPAESSDLLCLACRHNRTIPDLSLPQNLANWKKIEAAKHRLFYSLLRFRLPL